MTDHVTFTLAGAPAGLDFTVERPGDWVVVPLPEESHDFADPLHFAALAILMAPYAAVVFAVAARPAYGDGTVAQWLDYMSRQRGLDPGPIERQQLGPHAAVACWGLQVQDGTAMRARLVLCEDGGRMVQISCMAPEALWATFAPTFERMLQTFALCAPQGARAALAPADAPLAGDAAVQPPVAIPGPLPMPGLDEAPAALEPEPVAAAAVALAADQASFDPEHEMNARLRDRGAGLVPNVLDYDEQERWATLAPGALCATLRVPFGWHVIDDGRRALVFDATGHTQVSLQLFRRGAHGDDELLASKVAELQREWPGMRHLRTEVQGMQCLLVRDAVVNGAPIEQAYLLRAAPDDLVLQTRVTSTPERFRAACDLAAVLLRDLQFADQMTA